MSEPQTFSLAVVKGASTGATLRSSRKRISVGSARDNDLVLTDHGIGPRHFLILIDGPDWRIRTMADGQKVKVDHQWSHPSNGKRGALIQVGTVEIILFPGHLDQRTIDTEIARRRDDGPEDLATAVEIMKPDLSEGQPYDSYQEQTLSVAALQVPPSERADFSDGQVPTVAGHRPPDELREAAQQLLQERRSSSSLVKVDTPPSKAVMAKTALWHEDPPTIQPSSPPLKRKKPTTRWEQARKSGTRNHVNSAVPEVLATPESQVMPAFGSSKSGMSPNPLNNNMPRIPTADIEVEAPAEPSSSRSAWNKTPRSSGRSLVPSGDARKNAWDKADKKSHARSKNTWDSKNAWDSAKGRKPPTPPPESSVPPPSTQPPSDPITADANDIRFEIQSAQLMGVREPALQILRVPDGPFATATRLLGAKMEDLARNLGYRAYMVSSPEPLTGKTTAICNLAFALAEDTHRRVALIEANFRYPRFADIFGIEARLGLLPVLEGRSRLNEAGVKLSDRNLVILPSGGRHPNPAEVLASPRFKSIIAELANTVDIALIDAPSTHPHADANLILPLVDGAFFVVAERLTRRAWLDEALSQLGEKRVLGSLFNRIPKSDMKLLKKERKERNKNRD